MQHRYVSRGVTLLELLITLSVISILVVLGAPPLIDSFCSSNVKGAAEGSYFAMLYARSEAIASGTDSFIDFEDGASWCIGISDAGACDCTVVDSCQVNGNDYTIQGSDYPNTQMQNVTFVDDSSLIDSRRGTSAGNAGSLELTDGTNTLRLVMSNLARVRICIAEGSFSTYEGC